MIQKSAREIDLIAQAGAIAARTLGALRAAVRPGVTTGELDALADELVRAAGGEPTFKGHYGFTGAICASPNDLVVHGVPGPYELREGDVVTLDLGVTYRGWIADSALTVPVGAVDDASARLLASCQRALLGALEACRPGCRVLDIGARVQEQVEGDGFTIVPELGGHGVGRRLWEDPRVPNHGPRGHGATLRDGMVLAVEPIITAGTSQTVLHDDGWSMYTRDGSRSAHFEHTVAVTPDGPRVLTRDDGWSPVDDPVALAASS
jgi:methionyl aminopeptidase